MGSGFQGDGTIHTPLVPWQPH